MQALYALFMSDIWAYLEKMRRSGVVLAASAASLYFAAGAFTGPSSLHALEDLKTVEDRLLQAASELKAQRTDQESRVGDLSRLSLSPDRLEEEVRRTLNFAHPDEIIIYLGDSARF